MAYLELSAEAYDNLIRAAGNRAGSVAAVCNEQGTFDPDAHEAPPNVAEPDLYEPLADSEDD